MDKRFWAIVAAILVIFVGIIVVNNKKSSDTGSKSSSSNPTQHFTGNLTSKIQFQEYGDFQCPVCENYFQVVQQVQQKYSDSVRFQFSNLPLLQIHPNAFAAARAAEAAANQGKFWEMHDALYDAQNWQQWTASSNVLPYFKAYAASLKLDEAKFTKDFGSSTVNNRINADISAFKKTGQPESTPSFFINGKYYANSNFIDATGAPSVDAFSKVIDEVIKNTK
jgi:protein-disulfide isomerase